VIQRMREELRQGDWLTECLQILGHSLKSAALTSPDILCLGLGSPTSSLNARLQLGFLLEICEQLKVDHTRISIYDPVFTADDTYLFRELHLRLLTENKAERGIYIRKPHNLFHASL